MNSHRVRKSANLFLYFSSLLILSTLAQTASAQSGLPTTLSGTMTMHSPSLGSYVPDVFPGVITVEYSSEPAAGACTVEFMGMQCEGKLSDNGTCDFNSEDCITGSGHRGPAGWSCYFHRRGSEPEYGDTYGLVCTFPGDPRLSFKYSGSTGWDLTGGHLENR